MSLGAGDPEGAAWVRVQASLQVPTPPSVVAGTYLPITDPGLQVEKLAPRGVGEDPRPASHSTRRLWRCQQ